MIQKWQHRACLIQKVLDLYSTREYSQTEIANMLHMPVSLIRLILQANDYHRTLHCSPANPRGQIINPILFLDDYEILDRY